MGSQNSRRPTSTDGIPFLRSTTEASNRVLVDLQPVSQSPIQRRHPLSAATLARARLRRTFIENGIFEAMTSDSVGVCDSTILNQMNIEWKWIEGEGKNATNLMKNHRTVVNAYTLPLATFAWLARTSLLKSNIAQ